MAQTILTAGDATSGASILQGGNDGTLVVTVGPAGSKVNAISVATDGTMTLVKGPTIGSAPTPVPSGTAPVYGARAWCVFNGTTTGTNAPIAGGNVTSVTRNATGDYTITFATAMPDTNFAVCGTASAYGGNKNMLDEYTTGSRTITAVRVSVSASGGASALTDADVISVIVFR